MTRRLLLAAAAGLLIAASPAVPGDKDYLQGVWRLNAVQINGQPIALEDLKSDGKVLVGTLTVTGDSYVFTLGDARLAFTFAMNPAKTPKAIDMTVTEGPQKGQIYHGIYKLEGDMYTICRNTEPGKDRPSEFAAPANSGLMKVVWKRFQP